MSATYEELLKQNQALQRQNQSLTYKFKKSLEKINALEAKIKELQEKLNTNSQNSSKPPSQDSFSKKTDKPKEEIYLGAKKGHVGKTRIPFPEDKITDIIKYKPDKCPKCGSTDLQEFKVIERFQTIDIPKPKPLITEHRRIRCHCQKCGRAFNGNYPKDMCKKLLKPRLQAFIGLLISKYRLSRRMVKEVCRDLLGIEFSLGTTANIEKHISKVLDPPYKEIKREIEKSSLVHVDETGWFHQHRKLWLWIATNNKGSYFRIENSRSKKTAKNFLKNLKDSVVITDRYSAYTDIEKHQYCWAHLKRDFKKIEERGNVDWIIGHLLLKLYTKVFHEWHLFKKGKLKYDELQKNIIPLKEGLKETLKLAIELPSITKKTLGTCKNLLKHEENLWTFLYFKGVEPTNNLAERNLRPAVIWRKLSLGTHSEYGKNFVERTLTVMQTLKNQGKSAFTYLEQALSTHLQGNPVPSLFDYAPS